MKHLLSTIIILTCLPSFAACPVENGGACLAEFQGTGIPDITNPSANLLPNLPSANFSATPAAVNSGREYEPKKETRVFSSMEQNYGYNSSCQFGVCMDTGTPKIFPNEQN